jgi:small conductance mechanosensitive channel
MITTEEAVKNIDKLIVPDSVQKAHMAEFVTKIAHTDYQQLVNDMISQALWIGLKVVLAIGIYLVGRWVTNWILRMLNRTFERRNVDVSLRIFLRSMIKVVMMILVVLAAIQTLGINTTSFLAIFASAGLAIGMALSGTLQNFAGGVILLLLRPYRVGDYIMAQGQSGTVKAIGLFSTQLSTSDNRTIYVPNSAISTSVIDNYSTSEMRRVDWTVSVEYGTDPEKVRQVLVDMLKNDSRVAADPAPVVFLVNLADSSVQFSARAWCKNGDYWGLKFDIQERIYVELPKNGINFPFPQLDVNLKK